MQQPPTARRDPITREHHGDRFEDHYAWMADRDSEELRELLVAENAYATERTEHLRPLAEQVFEEFRSRIEETDLSVPVRHDRWWYYSRTVEGEQYAVEARVLVADHPARPTLEDGRPPAGEQVLLDQNEEGRDHEFFAVGASEVSPSGDLLAYAVDVVGDERYDVCVRRIEDASVLDDSVRRTGGSLAWSLDARHFFYTRVDEAWRPHQVWRHEVGTPAEDDLLVHEETDERFFVGVGSSRDDRYVIIAIGSKTTSEFRILDADDALGTPRVVAERRQGVEYDIEPFGDQLLVTHNANRVNFELAVAPASCTSADEWAPLGVTSEDEFVTGAEGFDDFIAVSLRREGGTGVRVVLRDPDAPNGLGAAHDVAVGEPIGTLHVGVNPEASTPTLQVVHESLVTPRTVEDYDVHSRTFTLLKQQHVRGDVDLTQYRQRREWATAAGRHADPDLDRAPARRRGRRQRTRTAQRVRRLRHLQRPVVLRRCASRCSTAAGSSPSRTCVAGPRWAAPGTTTASSRPSPTPSPTSSPAPTTSCETGLVAPDRLAAEGGSAGGLLMGAVVNLAPGALPLRPRPGALRRRADDGPRPEPAPHGRRVGGVGQPARGPRRHTPS